MGSLNTVQILSEEEAKLNKILQEYSYDGYHAGFTKEIVIKERELYKGMCGDDGDKEIQWNVLKHEIIHAFLYESGLDSNSFSYSGAWAVNEEMVDWLALQWEKIDYVMSEAKKRLDEVNED